MRLTGLVLSHLLVLVLLRRRLLDNLCLGLTLPLSLRRANRTAFTIVMALVALWQILAKVALRRTKLQAATAIALLGEPGISSAFIIGVALLTTLSRSHSSGTAPFASV